MDSEYREEKKHQQIHLEQQNETLNRQGQRFRGPGHTGTGEGQGDRQNVHVSRGQMLYGNPSQTTEQRRDFDLMSEEEQNSYVQEVRQQKEWGYYHDRMNAEVETPKKGEFVHPEDEFALMAKSLLKVQERINGRKEQTKNFMRMKTGLERFLSPEVQDVGALETALANLETEAQSYLDAHKGFTLNWGVSKKKTMARDILKAVRTMKKLIGRKDFDKEAKADLQLKKDESARLRREAEAERLRLEEEERLRQAEAERQRLAQEEEQRRQQEAADQQRIQELYLELRDTNNQIKKVLLAFNKPNDNEAIKKTRDQVQALIKQRAKAHNEFMAFWRQNKVSKELDDSYLAFRKEVDEYFDHFKFLYTSTGKKKLKAMKQEVEAYQKIDTDEKIFGSVACSKEATAVINKALQIPSDYRHSGFSPVETKKRMVDLNTALAEMHQVGLQLEQLTKEQYEQLKNNPGTKPLAYALLNDYKRRLHPPKKFEPKNEPRDFEGENFTMSLQGQHPILESAEMTTQIVTEEGQTETHQFTVYPNPMGIQKKQNFQGSNNVDNYGGICVSCSTASIANYLNQDEGVNENLAVEMRKQLKTDEEMITYWPERDEQGEILIDPKTKQKVISNIPNLSEAGGVSMLEIPRLLVANNLNFHFVKQELWGKGDEMVNALAEELKKGNTILGNVYQKVLKEGEGALKDNADGAEDAPDHAIHICSACYEKDANGNEVLKGFLVKNSGVRSKKEGAKDLGTFDFVPVERMKIAMVGTAEHPLAGIGGIVVENNRKGEMKQ